MIVVSLLLGVAIGKAQPAAAGSEVAAWEADPALFLEPNRLSVVKELDDRSLWLEMGFGRAIPFSGNNWKLGFEGLVWSRLRTLSDFRFPVETADYFFGTFLTWEEKDVRWRLRISHISSHNVDGKDSAIFGGSSSHYSREFVELMREAEWKPSESFHFTVGIRGYFHQVTKIEPWISFPVSISWRFMQTNPQAFGEQAGDVSYKSYFFVSDGDGPVWPTISGGIGLDRTAYTFGTLDLQLYYQYGASWAGTDAGMRRSTINLQMDVRGF